MTDAELLAGLEKRKITKRLPWREILEAIASGESYGSVAKRYGTWDTYISKMVRSVREHPEKLAEL